MSVKSFFDRPYPLTLSTFVSISPFNAYGSTVVVPDEWVTQTGSDFDVVS